MSKRKDFEGRKAKSFKGIPVAIEWHPDGSVTLAKEVVEEIRKTGDTSILIPPPPGTIHMMRDEYLHFGNLKGAR